MNLLTAKYEKVIVTEQDHTGLCDVIELSNMTLEEVSDKFKDLQFSWVIKIELMKPYEKSVD